ncbi:MAG: hypothetical protein ISR64_01045 [Deltaproteobacteria bacterium]|nr:hypothetical protein [Deltaproteobacteria bacterium]
MNSIEIFARLEGVFERLVKSLDRSILLDYCRRLEPMVYARYFKGYRPQTLGRKKVTEALHAQIFEKQNESLADILVLLWNQAHRDVYHAMLEQVKTISEDVETIEKIEDDKAIAFIDNIETRFDREDILICVCLNEVRFSPKIIETRLSGTPVSPPPGNAPPTEAPVMENDPPVSDTADADPS